MKSIEFAIPKKGIEDVIRGMNLDPDREYEICERTKYRNSFDVLGLKTENGKKVYHLASLFDIIREPVGSSERVLEDGK